MKLYGISGLGADKRVFEQLTLETDLVLLDWIEPLQKETLEDYAHRLSSRINKDEDYGIIGVSFGGLVAVEISKQLNPRITILISSAETRFELRPLYRVIGKTKLVNFLPYTCFDFPRNLANWVFGAKKTELLNQILDDTDLKFAKWAVNELINWKNTEKLTSQTLRIGGTNDKLIPPQKDKNTWLIHKGEHFMIVDRADEISWIVNHTINKKLQS